MKSLKQLGIYMDYEHAFLMEMENGMIISHDILSEFNENEIVDNRKMHFLGFHCAEKKFLQAIFFKKISNIIKHYQQVVLFSPTNIKNELLYLLNENSLFNRIKISIEDTEKLTNDEIHKYMLDYYK